MNKNTQKKTRNNGIAIKKLAEILGYSERYIRGCINREYDGIMPDKIRKDYKILEKSIEEALANAQVSEKILN